MRIHSALFPLIIITFFNSNTKSEPSVNSNDFDNSDNVNMTLSINNAEVFFYVKDYNLYI